MDTPLYGAKVQKVFRSMFAAGESGSPAIGGAASQLGVRAGFDVFPDEKGYLTNTEQGMSVSPSPNSLPPRLIPERLRAIYPQARGRNDLVLWTCREAPWISGPVVDELQLHIDKPTHGVWAPTVRISLVDFQNALAGTAKL